MSVFNLRSMFHNIYKIIVFHRFTQFTASFVCKLGKILVQYLEQIILFAPFSKIKAAYSFQIQLSINSR